MKQTSVFQIRKKDRRIGDLRSDFVKGFIEASMRASLKSFLQRHEKANRITLKSFLIKWTVV